MPVALIYPNTYSVGMSSLGFQLVYSLVNEYDSFVCERFFLPFPGEPLCSLESNRPLDQYPLVLFSISFEHDYLNLVRLLLAGGIPALARDRDTKIFPGQPLVLGGGVAVSMNPEPIAPFADLFFIGEAEAGLEQLLSFVKNNIAAASRQELLAEAAQTEGVYVPSLYSPEYGSDGRLTSYSAAAQVPGRVAKVYLADCTTAAHSEVLTPEAEFRDLYLTELGRGCSRGCRFCAAGFIYRPPRLWPADAVIHGLKERSADVRRIGLLGMEMADQDELAVLSEYLLASGCSLSFSSLRADRISSQLIDLLAESGLKSVAIAPDGASERLRRVINKGLSEDDLLTAADNLVRLGVSKLKLYLMIGLPTETMEDLEEFVLLVKKIKKRIIPIGKSRGRLSEIQISLNSFVPKPWTPFQYHPFGAGKIRQAGQEFSVTRGIESLKEKVRFLRAAFAGEANVRLTSDAPDKVLPQAVLARADRRMADVLLAMAYGKSWKQAVKENKLSPDLFIGRQGGKDDWYPWYVIDHGIETNYLWSEYLKAESEKATLPCRPDKCRLCGVCGD